MKSYMRYLSTLGLVSLLSIPSVHAAVVFSASDSIPTLGVDGIGNTASSNTDRLQQDYTDNAGKIPPFGDTIPGQTFTTGANMSGYLLDSFSFISNDFNISTATSFSVTLRTISGASASVVQNFNVNSTVSSSRGPGDAPTWYTFLFSGPDRVSLVANTLYGIDVSQSVGWTGLGRSSTSYSGGNSYYITSDGLTVTNEAGRADVAFAIDLTAVSAIPEPSTYAALVGFAVLGFSLSRRRRAA